MMDTKWFHTYNLRHLSNEFGEEANTSTPDTCPGKKEKKVGLEQLSGKRQPQMHDIIVKTNLEKLLGTE